MLANINMKKIAKFEGQTGEIMFLLFALNG